MSVDVRDLEHATSERGDEPCYVTVAQLDELAEGELRCVDLDGTPITIANADGIVYAFDAYCTHQAALLEEGELEGTEVLCPWHAGSFDIRTGQVTSAPPLEPLRTHEVRISGNDIQVLKD